MKRIFDIILSTVCLILLCPLFLAVALLIKLNSKGPVFFCQRRIGKDDTEFQMFKFRTMVVGTPEVATDKLTDSGRYITPIGHYLRKYSVDELPQLLNIFSGDMSFVGPRPALYNQYDLRTMRNELGISKILPGLTGWAQINGRDEIPLNQKVALDHYYLEQRSLLFDFKILLGTFSSVYSGTGTSVLVNGEESKAGN